MSAGAALEAAAPDVPGSRGSALRFFGLVLLLALVALVAFSALRTLRADPVDAQARRIELFGERPLPFGLELSGAVRTPAGAVVVTFARPGAVDGQAVAPEAGPDELIVIDHPRASAVDALFSITPGPDFASRLAEWQEEKAFAWHATLRRDDLAWGAWSTRQLVERAFEKGGGWRDSVRVDLSRPGRPRVLFAQWPREVEASESQLVAVLSALAMDPPESAAPKD